MQTVRADPETLALSPASRLWTRVTSIAFGIVGLVLFVAPAWAAPRFAWNVSEFVAMTIGGWCLGTAYVAWVAAREWTWGHVYPLLLYLWGFALLESTVLVAFRDRIPFGEVMTWPYLAALAIGLVTAVVGIVDWPRRRPTTDVPGDPRSPGWIRVLAVLFVLAVGFLAVKGILDPEAGLTKNVFPEELSPFTIRAFGVFYLAIAIPAIPLIFSRSLAPVLWYGRGGLGIIVPITVAALVYIGRFDFDAHPRQVLYIGAYVGVFVAAVVILWWASIRPPEPVTAGTASTNA